MAERLLLPVLTLLCVVSAYARAAYADSPALDAAIARLQELERADRDDAEGWHAVHHIVASGADAALLESFVKRIEPPSASLPYRHFAYDATPLGGGAREGGQAHFGQFALVLARHSKDRALVAELAKGLRAAPRTAQTRRAIESLPHELETIDVPADPALWRMWRARPDIQAKKALWSELDISWAVEAIARGSKGKDVTPLIDSQLALYALDRDFVALNFVPEFGVHILMMLCRVIPLLDATTAARYEKAADAMFAEMVSIGGAHDFLPWEYALFGHLFEVAWDAHAYRPAMTPAVEERLDVVMRATLTYIASPEPKDYGFVTHTLDGLRSARDLMAARAPRGETRPASSR